MKDKTYIRRVARVLCQLDNHEIKDIVGINRLLRLHCKYVNDGVEKQLEDTDVLLDEGEDKT